MTTNHSHSGSQRPLVVGGCHVEYLNKNFSLNLRKRPSDIISIAREFTEFIEED